MDVISGWVQICVVSPFRSVFVLTMEVMKNGQMEIDNQPYDAKYAWLARRWQKTI